MTSSAHHGATCSRRETHAARWLLRLAPLGLLFSLVPSPGHATVSVYHSPADDGARASAPLEIAINQSADLDLWIEKGSDATLTGVVCESGDGDEICAWDVAIELTGDVLIAGWTPDDIDFVGAPSGDGRTLKVNGLVPSPTSGPVRIGRLTVNAGSADGEVSNTGRQIVNARRQLETVSTSVLARVPEPGAMSSLAAGLLGLHALARHRSRRGSRR